MFDILLQTPDFVVINKPAGLSVHRDQNDSGLTEMLAQQLGVPQLWLVHRLDKPTSGALLLALNADAASELAQAFANREVKKTYLALGDRKPSKKQGWIKGDMVRSRQGAWKLTRSMENPAQTRFSSHSSPQPNTPHSSASTTAPASTAHSSILPPINPASSATTTIVATGR